MLGVCYIAGYLNTSVDRAGVHDDDFFVQLVEQVPVQSEVLCIFPQGRNVFDILTFQLNPQHICHITPTQRLQYIETSFYPHLFDVFGNKSGRTANPDLGPQFCQAKDIAQGYSRMQDVADNGNFLIGEVSKFFSHGVGVEQGLSRMFVGAVPGVNNVGVDMLGLEMGGAGGRMPDNDHIHFHRQDVIDRIE